MSDENIEVTTEQLEAAEAPTRPTITKQGYVLEYKTFERGTEAERFGFYSIGYTAVGAAVEKLGEKAVLAALNSAIASGLRTKAKMKLSDQETKESRQSENDQIFSRTDGVLLTPEDAEAFVPGVREKTSYASLMREARAAKEDGRVDEAKRLVALALEAAQRKAQEELGDLAAALK